MQVLLKHSSVCLPSTNICRKALYQVEIKRTIPKGSAQSKDFKTKNIFVGGIPSFVTSDEFKSFFSKYGMVVEHEIITDHVTMRSRGFGFVIFDSENLGGYRGVPSLGGYSSRLGSYGGAGGFGGGYGGGGGGFGGGAYGHDEGGLVVTEALVMVVVFTMVQVLVLA
ncbi:hypothetical protein KSP39_PZI016266 [Platanthera zijinensis]|uniref:RRM domain-containing protein n=1 Tax=Platanthera zijinensis TaxID=2320716 RepID=A0AAP0B6R4_9ASPA